jgi:hypothetical protein
MSAILFDRIELPGKGSGVSPRVVPSHYYAIQAIFHIIRPTSLS